MTARVSIKILTAGSCRHPEAIVTGGGAWKSKIFPSMFAFIEHSTFGRMLFDCGYSQRFHELSKSFPLNIYALVTPVTIEHEDEAPNQLRRLGIPVDSIQHIMVSHFHADHVGTLVDFPNTNFVLFRAAYHSVSNVTGFAALRAGFLPGSLPSNFESRMIPLEDMPKVPLPNSFSPFTDGYDLAGDGSLIAVALPGHCVGHAGLIVRTTDSGDYFLVADACWSTAAITELRLPHPITSLICSSMFEYRKTIKSLHDLHKRNPSLKIIPSHCDQAILTGAS